MRERTLRCLKIALFAILFSGIALNLSNPAFLKRKEIQPTTTTFSTTTTTTTTTTTRTMSNVQPSITTSSTTRTTQNSTTTIKHTTTKLEPTTRSTTSTSTITTTTSVQATISTTRTSCSGCDPYCSAIDCLEEDFGNDNQAKCLEKGCTFCEMPDGKPWCYFTEGMEIPGQNCHDCNCSKRSPCRPDNENDCVNAGCHWCPKPGEHFCIYGNFQTQCTSCDCPSELKIDCLPSWSGPTTPEQECNNRGCRWCRNPGRDPYCIVGPKPSNADCRIDNTNKTDCGYLEITQKECEDANCCYEPVNNGDNNDDGIPWCFFPSNFDY